MLTHRAQYRTTSRSLRLFRPRAEGDWSHVFDAAAAALMELAGR